MAMSVHSCHVLSCYNSAISFLTDSCFSIECLESATVDREAFNLDAMPISQGASMFVSAVPVLMIEVSFILELALVPTAIIR